MQVLRKLVAEGRDDFATSYRNGDSSIGVIAFDGGEYAVLTWYKDRGCTSNAVVMMDDEPILRLTLEDAEMILKEYAL
jgi:hypothetical protein